MGHVVLASGQWWRLLGVFRPSGAFVFVCRVDARDKPEKNQTGEATVLRQGHVMIRSNTPAFGPELGTS